MFLLCAPTTVLTFRVLIEFNKINETLSQFTRQHFQVKTEKFCQVLRLHEGRASWISYLGDSGSRDVVGNVPLLAHEQKNYLHDVSQKVRLARFHRKCFQKVTLNKCCCGK